MPVTDTTCADALTLLRGAGLGGLTDADPATWALVLNAAPRTVADQRTGRRTPLVDDRGVPVPLSPEDREVMPAAVQIATLGGRFVQAADLASAIQERREGDRAARRARIVADAQRHGPLLPEGLGDDVPAELAWRRAATAAVGAGATRAQAEAHAWRSIGRTPPQVGAGRDRSGAVRRLIAAGPSALEAAPRSA